MTSTNSSASVVDTDADDDDDVDIAKSTVTSKRNGRSCTTLTDCMQWTFIGRSGRKASTMSRPKHWSVPSKFERDSEAGAGVEVEVEFGSVVVVLVAMC